MADIDTESSEVIQPRAVGPLRRWASRQRLFRALALGLIAYFCICLAVFVFQDKLVYFPFKEYTLTPEDAGLEYESVRLTTEDGVQIVAWYLPREDAVGSLLYCHGNAGNLSQRVKPAAMLHRLGYNVLLFDYRGYGGSEGSPTEKGTYLDAEAAWKYLMEVKQEDPRRLIIYGRSLGGAVAVDLAARHQPAALVLECVFNCMVDVAKVHYPYLPVRLLVRYHYDSAAKIGAIRCPKIFFHGRDDEVVPFELGRRLFEAANEPKVFIETPGSHDYAGFKYSPKYAEQLDQLMREALAKSQP